MVDVGHNASERRENGVFVGNYTHGLDPKKRLTIPSEWREQAGEPHRLYVLPAIRRKCLCAYPAHEMSLRLEKLRNLSANDDVGRKHLRMLAARSDYLAWDAQGRIRIKDELLDLVGLKDQIVMVGTFYGFDLWAPENWQLELADTTDVSVLEKAARTAGFEDMI